jgi:hypothetical protein
MNHPFLLSVAFTTIAMLAGAAVLHLLPRLGAIGRRASDACCRAPALDLIITYFTVAPLFICPWVWRSPLAFVGAVVGQLAGLILWTILHELAHLRSFNGPRILITINRKVGVVRNLLATYWTLLVVPLFWFVRVAEIFAYPVLNWLVELPPYRQAEWVNVSRHKFRGLVGHDMVWCLYCDWMTGVWSLGTEMLRNVESFWCPIRFDSTKKCANCATDFPDIKHGWVDADGTMADVVNVLNEQYPPAQRPRAWFGHPVRVTVNGRPAEAVESLVAK